MSFCGQMGPLIYTLCNALGTIFYKDSQQHSDPQTFVSLVIVLTFYFMF